MHKIRGTECPGRRGRVGGEDIQCERIEFGIRINVIRVWKIRGIREIGINIICVLQILYILGIIITREGDLCRVYLEISM